MALVNTEINTALTRPTVSFGSWMDPVTTSKVFFVSGLEEIEKTFDELGVPKEYLPVRYGGLVEDEDSIPVPGFPTTLGKEKELQEDTGDKKE